MEKIIFMIIKIIKKIFIWIFAIILLLVLIRTVKVLIINPYKLKTEVIEKYKNKNVLLKRSDMRTGYSEGFITESPLGSTYWFEIVNPKQFKNKLFDIEYNKYGSYPLKENNPEYFFSPNIFYYSQVNYVISNLINDKSKGNDFEKIEEIIDKKSKEILNKGFYHSEYDKNSKFRLAVEILLPTNKEYEGNRVYISGEDRYILNEDKTIMTKISFEDIDYGLYERKFKEMTRYTEIDWEEYMKENKSLVFLIPYELSNNSFGLKYYEDEKEEDKESVEYLMKLFKEFEKYYNKDTYRFAVLKWGIKE